MGALSNRDGCDQHLGMIEQILMDYLLDFGSGLFYLARGRSPTRARLDLGVWSSKEGFVAAPSGTSRYPLPP
jgi:hypothetical protein